MKRKDILNMLKLEVENQLPDKDVLNEVKSTKVDKDLTPVYDEIYGEDANTTLVKNNRYSIIGFMGAALLMLLLLSWIMPIIARWFSPESLVVSRLSIDINPSIELMLDRNNEVVMAIAKNHHAEVLLHDENLKGMSAESATERIVSLALKTGYFDLSETEDVVNAVMMSVDCDDEKRQTETLNKVKKCVSNFYMVNQLYGVVLTQFASKTDFIDTIATLDVSVSDADKQIMQSYSIRNLNKMFAKVYMDLRHRFNNDYAVNDVLDKVTPVFDSYTETHNALMKELETNRDKYNNFDKEWSESKRICEEKIRFWKAELERLRSEQNQGASQASDIDTDIELKQQFLDQEEQQLNERYNCQAVFEAEKTQAELNVEECQKRINNAYDAYINNIQGEINKAKIEINQRHSKLRGIKNHLMQVGRDPFLKHQDDRIDYNKFYNKYSAWVDNNVTTTNNMLKDWKTYRDMWEANINTRINV